MRLAIVTPFYFPSVRGNSITVQRIESGLKDQGVEVRVFSLEEYDGGASLREGLDQFRPDVLHGFHAYASGRVVIEAAERLKAASVITATGTDINHDLFDPERRLYVLEALRKASAIVVFHEVMKGKILAEIPEADGKIRAIKQTVRCHEKPYDFLGKLGFQNGDFIFFVPAGVRKVKNVTFCLKPLTKLHQVYPQIKVVFVGPVIEEEEGERLLQAIKGLPWAFYLGPVSHEELCAMLRSVDVVLNTSLSEGGMANAILEAMSRGVAVLASDIEGNRSVVRDGIDGLLFASEEEFLKKAEALIRGEGLRRRLGEAAREKIEKEFPWEGEIQDYLALYRELLHLDAG